MIIDKLQEFRQQAYNFLRDGRDAIFDLMDAVLTLVFSLSIAVANLVRT